MTARIFGSVLLAQKSGYVEIDLVTGKAKVETIAETEKRVKCNTCGHLYCYNGADLEQNSHNAKMATLNSVGAMANAIGGAQLGAHAQNSSAQRYLDKIVDYSRCPKCNSSDVRILSAEEYEKEKAIPTAPNNCGAFVSAADELKNSKSCLTWALSHRKSSTQRKSSCLVYN